MIWTSWGWKLARPAPEAEGGARRPCDAGLTLPRTKWFMNMDGEKKPESAAPNKGGQPPKIILGINATFEEVIHALVKPVKVVRGK